MSFILDALRKSENERQQKTATPLAAPPRAAPDEKPSIWMPILIVVLACNALLVGYLLFDRSQESTVEPATEREVRSLRKESMVAPPASVPEPAPVPAPQPAVTPEPAAAPVREPAPQPAPASQPVVRQSVQEGLPSFAQLSAAGVINVGELRVDMHVYAGEVDKRFVFINMKKYKEGEQLSEGPMIEAITQDGIVLTHQGSRFRLDRD